MALNASALGKLQSHRATMRPSGGQLIEQQRCPAADADRADADPLVGPRLVAGGQNAGRNQWGAATPPARASARASEVAVVRAGSYVCLLRMWRGMPHYNKLVGRRECSPACRGGIRGCRGCRASKGGVAINPGRASHSERSEESQAGVPVRARFFMALRTTPRAQNDATRAELSATGSE